MQRPAVHGIASRRENGENAGFGDYGKCREGSLLDEKRAMFCDL